MREPSLTRRPERHPDGRLVSRYDIEAGAFWVADGAREALSVLSLFKDRQATAKQKADALYRRMLPCPASLWGRSAEEVTRIIEELAWQAYGLDVTSGHEHASECDEPVFDYDEDAARIKASLLAYYGIDWDKACDDMTFADASALLSQICESDRTESLSGLPTFTTPFAQAIFYRTAKPPKPTKANKGLREAFAAMRDRLAMGSKRSSAEAANDATSGMVESMLRAARKGR